MGSALSEALAPPNLESIVLEQAEQWLRQCHSFRRWYRENIVLSHPTPDKAKLAEEIQPWMIRITRALLSQLLDPEFPHQHLARSVEATLWQLEEDWRSRHNPMTETEANAIIQTHFPGDAS